MLSSLLPTQMCFDVFEEVFFVVVVFIYFFGRKMKYYLKTVHTSKIIAFYL